MKRRLLSSRGVVGLALVLAFSVMLAACRVAASEPAGPSTGTGHHFSNAATLTDFEVDPARQILKLSWELGVEAAQEHTVFVHWLDSQGKLTAQIDRSLPVGQGQPGKRIVSEYTWDELSLPAGTYWLQVGLYNADTGERLPVEGQVAGVVTLAELEIED